MIMNDGVRILIERMKSHPEDFTQRSRFSKYVQMLHATFGGASTVVYSTGNPLWFLDEEDKAALKAAWASIYADIFSTEVMTTLLDDNWDRREIAEEAQKSLWGMQSQIQAAQVQAQMARNNLANSGLANAQNSLLGSGQNGISIF